MGDRANIEMGFSDGNKIYFYTHWGGYELPNTLKLALVRGKSRWNDEPYLARVVFSEMIKDEIFDTTGYGISPYIGDNEHPIIAVNLSNQTVSIDGLGEWSFEEFIKINLNGF